MRTAHTRYGVVLGITEAVAETEEAQPANLREPLSALRTAMGRYMQRLVGTHDDEDPDAVRAVRAALRPVDDFRAAAASRSRDRATAPAPSGGTAPVTAF